MVAWSALNAKRAGLSRRPIRVKRVSIGLSIILIAGEAPSATPSENLSARFDALAPRRAVSVKTTSYCWLAKEGGDEAANDYFDDDLQHASAATGRSRDRPPPIAF
jgi:hypothetical protein